MQQDYSDQSTVGGLPVHLTCSSRTVTVEEIQTGLYTDTEEDELEDVSVPRSAIVEEHELQEHWQESAEALTEP